MNKFKQVIRFFLTICFFFQSCAPAAYALWDNIDDLFGFRDDQDSYCNPGSKSDLSDKGLHFTGGRESDEGTFNIYAPHPELLKSKPFVDLYSMKEQTPFLNRMYFVEQEYIDTEIFNKRLDITSIQYLNKDLLNFTNTSKIKRLKNDE